MTTTSKRVLGYVLLALVSYGIAAGTHAQQGRVVPIETTVLSMADAPGGDLDEACATAGINAIQ